MRLHLRSKRAAGAVPGRSGAARAGHRLRSAVETGVLAGLLLVAAASVIVGASAVLFCSVVGAWLALTVIVGVRKVLDAGCAFMLLVVGVILVVELATSGLGSLLP